MAFQMGGCKVSSRQHHYSFLLWSDNMTTNLCENPNVQEEEKSVESLVIGGVAAAIFLIAVALIVVTLNLKQTNMGGEMYLMMILRR